MPMATKSEVITLNVDLYENVMTEKKGDYTGKARITGTLHNAEIAARIVAERTEYRQETIENILTMADQAKVEAIAEGKSVVDGVGQYLVTVRGSFIGQDAQFDSEQHSLSVAYTPGALLRRTLKEVRVVCHGTATTGPVINSITDSTTKSVNGLLTAGGPAVIEGSLLKIAGDDPSVGVYFTPDEPDAQPLKVSVFIENMPSKLIVMLPALDDEKLYTLSVVTQFAKSGTILKAPRTYTFPFLLGEENTGGGDDQEAPDPVLPGGDGDDDEESPDPIV